MYDAHDYGFGFIPYVTPANWTKTAWNYWSKYGIQEGVSRAGEEGTEMATRNVTTVVQTVTPDALTDIPQQLEDTREKARMWGIRALGLGAALLVVGATYKLTRKKKRKNGRSRRQR
jgi:hypothetical protein